jgi:hypothetical protein
MLHFMKYVYSKVNIFEITSWFSYQLKWFCILSFQKKEILEEHI